ncbi:MAG: acyl-CoA dehydratase activase [bacterium]|nr:acyl-CoA dehydratase activase [bacterium]
MKSYYIGIDIGSACTKTAVLDGKGLLLKVSAQPTGWSSADAADNVKERLRLEGINLQDSLCVATGYGRVSVPFAVKTVTEITCHARGAVWLYGCPDLTVIDVGGQDTKVIAVRRGKVSDFIMNDKCSAGTGRFLDVMSNSLGVRQAELCELASHGGGVTISSMCTVFAESEVIGLIGRGEPRENIAYAVIDSIVKKVASQAKRLNANNAQVCLSGGLCNFNYIRTALERELQISVLSEKRGQYAGAIGAALCAADCQRE